MLPYFGLLHENIRTIHSVKTNSVANICSLKIVVGHPSGKKRVSESNMSMTPERYYKGFESN